MMHRRDFLTRTLQGSSLLALGSVVRLELTRHDNGEVVEAEMPREQTTTSPQERRDEWACAAARSGG